MGGRLPEAGADLTTLAKRHTERALEGVRAVTLARVATFTGSTGARRQPTATVEPLVPRWVDDDDPIHDGPLDDVPVFFPGSRGLRLDWALSAGDFVVVLFCDRAIDDVIVQLMGSGSLDPQPTNRASTHLHELGNAVAIPVATFGNATQVDLLDLLRDFLALVQTATTGLGDATLNPALQAQVALMVARLDGVR